jgi:ankyrin repeat protein
MSKIILLSVFVICLSVSIFSQEAKNQTVSDKMVKAIEQNLPDWTVIQKPKLSNEGIRNNPKFEIKIEDNKNRKARIEVYLIEDVKIKDFYFKNYFRRSIMPPDSNKIDKFVDEGFLVGTGRSIDVIFSKANLVVRIDFTLPTKLSKKTPDYYLFAPKEEKDKILKIVEILAKSIESAANLQDCQNTFFKYPSMPNENFEDKLLSASASGDADEVGKILKQPVNPNYRLTKNTNFAHISNSLGNTALHFAAKQGCIETAKTLVAAKADMNAANERGETPLMLAANHSNSEVALFLISSNADVQAESFGRNAAFFSVRATQNILVGDGYLDGRIQKMSEAARTTLKELSAKGLDLKKKDSRDGNTLLTELLSNSDGDFAFETAQLLLELGVDTNEANNTGETPLLVKANRFGTDGVKIMKLLISQGADVNKRNKNNQTVLSVLLKKQIDYKNDVNYSKIINEAIELLKYSGAKE